MNITEDIIIEMNPKIQSILKEIPQIQVYIDGELIMWRDCRYENTSCEWTNDMYRSLDDFKKFLIDYLVRNNDISNLDV